MSANYILLRSSGYYLRYNTPKRFKEVLCKRELRYTLKTHLLSEAKRRARKLVCRIETLLEDLQKKSMNLTDTEIHALIQQHVNLERQWIEESYLTTKFQHKDVAAEHADTIEHVVGYLQEDLAANNFRKVEAEVIKLLKDHSDMEIDTESLPFLKLCREYSRCKIELSKYNESLLRGRDLLGATTYLKPSITHSARPDNHPLDDTPLIDSIIEDFLSDHLAGKGIGKDAIEGYRTSIRDLQDVLGNVTVKSISYDDGCKFRDTLLKLPKNRNKLKQFKDLSIPEILQLSLPPEIERISGVTVAGRMTNCKTIFDWLVARRIIDQNPFSNIKTISKKRERDLFDSEDLALFFSSALYTQGHDYRQRPTTKASHWWLPLLALFTGARAGELIQMRLEDVMTIDEVLSFRIVDDEEAGQRVKTEAGRRTLPVHPTLLSLGFNTYLREIKESGLDRVLGALSASGRKPSVSATRWYGDTYRKKHLPARFEGDGLSLHSFRHTYITAALNSGIDVRHVQQLVGHEQGRTMGATATYDKGAPIPQLFEEIKKIQFDAVDVGRLKDGWKGLALL